VLRLLERDQVGQVGHGIAPPLGPRTAEASSIASAAGGSVSLRRANRNPVTGPSRHNRQAAWTRARGRVDPRPDVPIRLPSARDGPARDHLPLDRLSWRTA